MSIFLQMDDLELCKHSGFRCDFGIRLQDCRAPSPVQFGRDTIALGRRCAATDIFLGAQMVHARARLGLPGRVRFTLGAGGRTDRREWNFTSPPISSGGARAARRKCAVRFADALLVQFK